MDIDVRILLAGIVFTIFSFAAISGEVGWINAMPFWKSLCACYILVGLVSYFIEGGLRLILEPSEGDKIFGFVILITLTVLFLVLLPTIKSNWVDDYYGRLLIGEIIYLYALRWPAGALLKQ